MATSPVFLNSRIDLTFARLRSEKKKGLIAYIVGGDPSLEATVEIAKTLEEAGVDILELGIAFSDPLADGPTIQAASQRALSAGASVPAVLRIVSTLREHSELPIVLFTYLNPLFAYGLERFYKDAAACGVDGVLILDLPPEEENTPCASLQPIRLIAPTTPEERVAILVENAQGFIYCVSREGVTGEQAELSETIAHQVERVRRHTALPIAVGFGISSPAQVQAVATHADAVVIGSAIVRHIAAHADSPTRNREILAFVQPLVAAAHAVYAP